jgi:hypothetical protein
MYIFDLINKLWASLPKNRRKQKMINKYDRIVHKLEF